jgi:hypothetical protein
MLVQLTWVGANPHTVVTGADRLPGVYHSYVGEAADWRTNIATYAAVHYHDLYPRIDLRYDGQGGSLKGTYTGAPGANPVHIRWGYQGAQTVIRCKDRQPFDPAR